jgi:hypothetical protein
MGEVNLLGLDSFGQNPGMSPITGALIGGGVANLTSLAVGNLSMFQTTSTPGGTPAAANRHLYGLLAGLAATGGLWLSGPTRARHAAWGSLVGVILTEGLPMLEKFILGTVTVPAPVAQAGAAVITAAGASAAAGGAPAPVAPGVTVSATPAPAGTSGMGMARIHALNGGLGMRRQAGGQYLHGLGIARIHELNGARGGLGLATVANQPQSVGTIPGVHGPSFAGTQLGANKPPVNLLGNPTAQSAQVSLLGGPPVHGMGAAYGATLLGGGRG